MSTFGWRPARPGFGVRPPLATRYQTCWSRCNRRLWRPTNLAHSPLQSTAARLQLMIANGWSLRHAWRCDYRLREQRHPRISRAANYDFSRGVRSSQFRLGLSAYVSAFTCWLVSAYVSAFTCWLVFACALLSARSLSPSTPKRRALALHRRGRRMPKEGTEHLGIVVVMRRCSSKHLCCWGQASRSAKPGSVPRASNGSERMLGCVSEGECLCLIAHHAHDARDCKHPKTTSQN